ARVRQLAQALPCGWVPETHGNAVAAASHGQRVAGREPPAADLQALTQQGLALAGLAVAGQGPAQGGQRLADGAAVAGPGLPLDLERLAQGRSGLGSVPLLQQVFGPLVKGSGQPGVARPQQLAPAIQGPAEMLPGLDLFARRQKDRAECRQRGQAVRLLVCSSSLANTRPGL